MRKSVKIGTVLLVLGALVPAKEQQK